MNAQQVLIHLTCQCGYEESVGIGISMGIVIKGSVTLICPRCGAITSADNATVMVPVSFRSERGPRFTSTPPQPEA